jgi:hypothetical protein
MRSTIVHGKTACHSTQNPYRMPSRLPLPQNTMIRYSNNFLETNMRTDRSSFRDTKKLHGLRELMESDDAFIERGMWVKRGTRSGIARAVCWAWERTVEKCGPRQS